MILLSVALIRWALLAGTRGCRSCRAASRPPTEAAYGLVRNGVGRDIIGSHDFLRFVPLLFTLFVLIIVNNLFSIVPVIQFPTMGRSAFPAALSLVVFVRLPRGRHPKHGFFGYFKSIVPAGPADRPLIPSSSSSS